MIEEKSQTYKPALAQARKTGEIGDNLLVTFFASIMAVIPLAKARRQGSNIFRLLSVPGTAFPWLYLLFIRPWHLHWGATAQEKREALPGDEILPWPKMEATRAITIQARVEEIWPWLVQLGFGRANWYTYYIADRLWGVYGRKGWTPNADRILPEFQNLKVGDLVPDGPAANANYKVVRLEKNYCLVLHSCRNVISGEPVDPEKPNSGAYGNFSWAFVLKEVPPGTSRLVIRLRWDYRPRLLGAILAHLVFEPADSILQIGILKGLRQRVELKR